MAVDNLRKKLFDNEIELNSIIDLEVQGIITRSRAQWTEEGEKSTKSPLSTFLGWKNLTARKSLSAN